MCVDTVKLNTHLYIFMFFLLLDTSFFIQDFPAFDDTKGGWLHANHALFVTPRFCGAAAAALVCQMQNDSTGQRRRCSPPPSRRQFNHRIMNSSLWHTHINLKDAHFKCFTQGIKKRPLSFVSRQRLCFHLSAEKFLDETLAELCWPSPSCQS